MRIKAPELSLEGQFRVVVSSDHDLANVTQDTGWFNNLITDVGLNRIGSYDSSSATNILGRFVLGAGSAQPQPTDTALQSPIVRAPGDFVVLTPTSSYDDGYAQYRYRYQFGQGVAQGNLSEIGLQEGSLSGSLWSRALILNAAGEPTTITVLDTDFLTVYYSLRVYIPKTDSVYNIDVDYDEEGIVPTVATCRPLNANSANPAVSPSWRFQAFSGNPETFKNGGLSEPTASSPLGSDAGDRVPSSTKEPYVEGSYEMWITHRAGLSQANSDTLRSFPVNSMLGSWQVEFDPPLIKNNTHTMDLTFGISWARA